MKQNKRFIDLLLIQANVLVFSFSSVLMKLAGQRELLSWGFLLLYGAGIGLLGIYAIFWQQILKRVSLSFAYANRALTMLYSMLFGALFFGEAITWNMMLGAAVIGLGIFIMVTDTRGEQA